MKKSLIALGVLVVVILALPIVGNSIVKANINEKVAELQKHGIVSRHSEVKSAYLSTKMYFEFLIDDADLFLKYLDSLSDNKSPSYLISAVKGAVLGVELKYSNILFSKSFLVDIFLVEIPTSIENSLQNENPDILAYIKNLIGQKGFLYQINYNIDSKIFDGYLKNIDENQTFMSGIEFHCLIDGFTFEGIGNPLDAQKLTTSLLDFKLSFQKKEESILFSLKNFTTLNDSDTINNYKSEFNFEKLDFFVKEVENNMAIKVKNAKFESSLDTKNSIANIKSKNTIEEASMVYQDFDILLKSATFDVGIGGLDFLSYQALFETFTKINRSDAMVDPYMIQEMKNKLNILLSKGLLLDIGEFSIKNVELRNKHSFNGFSFTSKLKLLEDSNFAQKLQLSPLLLLSNFEVNSKLKLSKELYYFLMDESMREFVDDYLKEDGDMYIFDISYQNAQVKINNKYLQ